jgi:hypothetical protein
VLTDTLISVEWVAVETVPQRPWSSLEQLNRSPQSLPSPTFSEPCWSPGSTGATRPIVQLSSLRPGSAGLAKVPMGLVVAELGLVLRQPVLPQAPVRQGACPIHSSHRRLWTGAMPGPTWMVSLESDQSRAFA